MVHGQITIYLAAILEMSLQITVARLNHIGLGGQSQRFAFHGFRGRGRLLTRNVTRRRFTV